MKLFDYSIKIKAILVASVVVLVAIIIFLVNYNNSYARDLEKVNKAREVATALENYFAKHYAYPIMDKINISNIQAITENGINQSGDYLYFRAGSEAIDASLFSSAERYVIEFDLDNTWEVWGIDSSDGGTCRISNYLEMICRSQT